MRAIASPMCLAGCLAAWLALGCSAPVDSVRSGSQPSNAAAEHAPASQAESPSQGQPTCALLDVSRSPLAALVEARLLEGKAKWLERSGIDKILAEQKLQAALGAEAGQERIRLGRLLKANVLAILRTGEKGEKEKQKFAELVVAETAGGLRLSAQSVFLSGHAEADAAAVVEMVHEALKKYGQKIHEVYAVPPLVSQDLTYEHEHLRSTYGKLVEQKLLEQPGALVVELAEAETLAKEYNLAAPGEKPNRRLPLYLLGEYRHEGRGEGLRVTIALRAKRGEQQILEAKQTLPPAEAPRFLQETAVRLIQDVAAQPPKSDPAAEARQLAERGSAALRLGNWQEAHWLLESSLLLNPKPLEARRELLQVYGLRQSVDPLRVTDPEVWRELLGRRLRAVQLLESLFADDRDLGRLIQSADRLFLYRLKGEQLVHVPEDSRKQFRQLREEEHKLEMQLVHRLAEQGEWSASVTWLRSSLEDRAPRDRYAEQAKLILQYQDGPSPHTMVREFVLLGRVPGHLYSIEGQQFLRDLLASPQLKDRKTVEEIQAQSVKEAPELFAEPAAKPSLKSAKEGPGPLFLPIEIACEFADGSTGKALLRDEKAFWLALDNGMDVFTDGNGTSPEASLFAIQEKGRAKRLWGTTLSNTQFESLEYDGHYLWMVARTYGQTPQVWVIDPALEKTWQITAEHGLPLAAPKNARGLQVVMASPVGPGRAILAGGFGRGWVADVRFDPAGKHQVKVFHEAREVFDSRNYATRGLGTEFLPRSMLTFSGAASDGTVRQRVFVERHQPLTGALVVDPEKPAVERLEESYFMADNACFHQGAIYYVGMSSREGIYALMRRGLPDLKPTVILDEVQDGRVLIQQDTLHIAGKQWWRGSLAEKRLACVGDTPWTQTSPSSGDAYRLTKVAASSHYGIIVAYRKGPPNRYELAQVVFDAPPGAAAQAGKAVSQPAPRTRGPSRSVESLRPGRKPGIGQWLWRDLHACSSLAYSPNGKLVITTGGAAAVQAWNAQDGQLLGNLLDSSMGMGVVTFSPDGRFFTTVATNGEVVLWSAEELKPLRILTGHKGQLQDLALSSDGRWLASCGWDSTLHVWNAQTGEEKFGTGRLSTGADRILFLPDGKRLLSSSHEGVLVWDIESPSSPMRLESLRSFAGLLPDGTVLGTADNGTLSLVAWNPKTQALRHLWDETPGEPVSVSPDGRYIVLRRAEGEFRDGRLVNQVSPVHLHEIATGREIPIGDSSYVPMKAVFSADGKTLATTTVTGGGLRRWDLDLQTSDAAQRSDESRKSAQGLAGRGADGSAALPAGSSSKTPPAAETRSESLAQTNRLFTGLVFSPDGKMLVTSGLDGSGDQQGVQAWNFPEGRMLADRPERGRVTRIVFSRSGKYVATGSRDGDVIVWAVDGFQPVHRITGHDQEIMALAFSWDDKFLASCDKKHTLRVWNLSSGKEQYRVLDTKTTLWWLGFTADGTRLIGSSQSGETLSWDSQAWRPAAPIASLKHLVDFLPDKSLLATSADGRLVAWEPATGTARTLWERCSGVPLGVSGDGQWIAVFGSDPHVDRVRTPFSRLHVYNLKTQEQRVRTLFAGRPQCSLSRDGKLFMTADQTGMLWTWNLEKTVPFALSSAAAAGEEKEEMEGFGKPVDPDGDCSLKVEQRVLTITVPGTLHDLNPEKNKINAPRVLRDAEGDFIVETCVDALFQPKEGRSQSAGLLVMQDERNFIRFELVAEGRGDGGKTERCLQVEVRQDGAVPADGTFQGWGPEKTRFLRIERRGKLVAAYCSANGGQWYAVARRVFPLPAGVKIGVTASNQSDAPLTAKFYAFHFLDQR